ncbi:MAG: DegT/DnrJ/EryC1/StrS family aminotransferase [Gammaproteobacteria bacterium]|nr:DegT/DnrJ/EryC1/StrS family aminotransferase [Gammaproteobacteria bacterium]
MHAVTKTQPVPFLDLTAQYKSLESEWLAAIRETGARGSFILGPHTQAFEKEFSEYVGVRHAIAVANGTDSLYLSLRALGIRRGDEVITTPFTFFASAETIDMVGATPVFVDILPDSFCLDPASVRAKVTSRTRAIVPVHIFGYPSEMGEIMEIARQHKLAVIEDCAQSFGSRHNGKVTGSIGDTGSFSFYPTKVLGCYGDGGMVTTNSDEVNDHIRRLRNHGAVKPFVHTEIGTNSRLDEIQAALLRLKLRHIENDIAGRQKVAAEYTKRLAGTAVKAPPLPKQGTHVFNLYTVRVPKRDSVRQALTEAQIGTSQCYPQGLHLQEVYKHLGYRPGSLPVCEQACTETLSLPIYPGMPLEHVERVCEVIREAVGRPA